MTAQSWKMAAFFVATYATLNLGYFLLPDSILKDVHYVALLRPCALIINMINGLESVTVSGGALVSNGIQLAIVRGCDGFGVAALLVAGVVCFPVQLRLKIIGASLGVMIVYILNNIRIVALYFVMRYHHEVFPDLHNLFIPTLMLLICGLAFLWWTKQVNILSGK